MSLLGRLIGSTDEQRTIGPWDDWTPKHGGARLNERTAMSLSTVWACQTLIADSISTLPVHVFRKAADGSREEVAAPTWVENPNPIDNRVDYDTQRLLSLLGWGNAFSLLVPAAGGLERWPVDPWRVTVIRHGFDLTYLIDGTPVPSENIHHVRGYIAPGTSVGMSVVETARRSLGLSSEAEEYGSAFFTRGVNPSGVLEVPNMPADVKAETVDRLREEFASRYGGVHNSHKPAVLLGGTSWKQISVNPNDAQFLETRMFQVEEVCRWFRVPPHEVSHITEHASQGGGQGIEAQSLNLARKTLAPWVARLEHADRRLLRGDYLKYNLDAFVRADIKTRYEAHKMGREGGWLSANDVRRMEDMEPITNGDRYLESLNFGEAGVGPQTWVDKKEPTNGPE